MGRYSYTQPSDSKDYGEERADSGISSTEELIRRDQAELDIKYGGGGEPAQKYVHYPPQPEVEFGFPQTCYCGGEPQLATSKTNNHVGRLYYTCAQADDGDMHVWKWWDDAVMEEMRVMDRHVLQLAEKVDNITGFADYETEQRLLKLENLVTDLAKKRSTFSNRFVGVMIMICVGIGLVISFK